MLAAMVGLLPTGLRRGVLSTDAYQLTMAQLYLRAGLADRTVRFEHFFRSYPDYGTHQAGYCVAAGLAPFAEWMTTVRATPADVEALRGHRSRHRRSAVRRRVLRLVRRRRLRRPAPRRRRRGPGRAPQHPDHRRRGPARGGPADRDPAAQPAQLRDAHRDQGGPGRRRLAGSARCSSSGCAAPGPRVPTPRHGRRSSAEPCRRRTRPSATSSAARRPAPTPTRWSSCSSPSAVARRPPSTPTPTCTRTTASCSSTPSTRSAAASPTPSPRSSGCAGPGTEPVGIRLDSGDLAYLAVQAARALDVAGFPDTVDRPVEPARRADDLADHLPDRRPRPAGPASNRTPWSAGWSWASARGWRRATATRASTASTSWSPCATRAGAWRLGDQALGLAGEGAQSRRQAAVAAVGRPGSGHRRRDVGRRRGARARASTSCSTTTPTPTSAGC